MELINNFLASTTIRTNITQRLPIMKPSELNIEFINEIILGYWKGKGLFASHIQNETANGLFDIFGIGTMHGDKTCQYDFRDISKLEVINCILLNVSRNELLEKLDIEIQYPDDEYNQECPDDE
jgi:hypothetical protein